MARKNKLGNSFCGLKLEKEEEQKWKKFLKGKAISAKHHLRFLVRQFLKQEKP